MSWLVTRLSRRFVLDTVWISRDGGDVLDPLLITAILEANQAPINQDPGLQLAYGTLEAAAPDALRRPVSVNAIAQSLRLPFETVRRRVRRLERAGLCRFTPRGVYVPHSAVTSPAYNAIQLARHERLRRFYGELKDAGVLAGPVVLGSAPASNGQPVRAVNRVLAEYMLRVADSMMGVTGGVLNSMVFLEMAQANAEHLTPADLNAKGPLAEGLRRPVRAAGLSARLGLPAETIRRHVIMLEVAGFCQRTGKGLLAAAHPSALPALDRIIEENVLNVQRMFARLDQLGVLALWESEAAADKMVVSGRV